METIVVVEFILSNANIVPVLWNVIRVVNFPLCCAVVPWLLIAPDVTTVAAFLIPLEAVI